MSHTFIDDQDLSRVKYQGRWLRGGGPSEHQGTVASSTVEGDYFTVSFYGTTITAFGTIDATSGGVLTNYSIDGAPPDQVTSQAGGGDTYDQQFWRSGSLSVGNHELKVTMVKINHIDSEPNEGTIWFDYFKVTDPTIRADSASRKRNIGEIVGGVLGGVIVLGALLTVWVMLRKRQRQKGGSSKHSGHERLPESEKELSNMPSGHVEESRSMGGRGAIRPFIDPPSNSNPSSSDQTNISSTGPITPTTPITLSGIVPPQKLLQELSRSQAQLSSSSQTSTVTVSELRGSKHVNLASLSTLTSPSAAHSFAPVEGPDYGSSSSAPQNTRGSSTSSPMTPTVRLSPIFLAAPERPSASATLTAKQEAIISTATDRNGAAQESFEDMHREGVHGLLQAASRSDLALGGDRQGQAPIILHVDSGVRTALRLDNQGEDGVTSSGRAGGSDASLTGPETASASPIPIELPPVYSPV